MPYNIAQVDLEEGLRILTNVVGCSNADKGASSSYSGASVLQMNPWAQLRKPLTMEDY